MLSIIKWFFYGFVCVLLWQVAHKTNYDTEQFGNISLRLDKNLRNEAPKTSLQTHKI